MAMRARLALDRSTRTTDQDGHLHIGTSVLTAAGVQGYRGSEIPDSDKLGLDPFRIYNLLRPADELKRAASTLARKPILMRHIAISATDHPAEDVCGAVGSDVVFDGNVVRSSLTFWTGDAIDAVESGAMRDVSCGYWFKADMTPGTYQGARYDGVMRDLAFNHLAIVVDGRVPGAMVGDSALRTTIMDEDDDAPVVTAPDPHSALFQWLSEQLPPDQMTTAEELVNSLIDWISSDGSRQVGDAKPRNRVYTGRNSVSDTTVIRRIQAIEQARAAVRPLVGDLPMGFDSADQVYVAAMEHLGRDCDDIKAYAGAAKAIWPTFRTHHQGVNVRRAPAMDAKATTRRETMFPNARRLGY